MDRVSLVTESQVTVFPSVHASFSFKGTDWIGFDMDHTLVRYKQLSTSTLIFNCLRTAFVQEKKYPERILSAVYDHDFAVKGIVFDLDLGNFIKMNALKKVVRAYHGLTLLTPEQVSQTYPEPLHELEDEGTARFKPILTFFDSPAIYLLGVIIDAVEKENLTVTYPNERIWKDLIFSFEYTFSEFTRGEYFDSFRRNLYKYIYRRPEVREWLLTLREQGCRLFLVTNSHFDYTDLLLSYSFGEDWRSLFDISIVYAQKPSFFKNFNSFKAVDVSASLELHDEVNFCQFKRHGVYGQGNWTHLTRGFVMLDSQAKVKTDGPEYPVVIYFGDHIRSDVMATRTHTDWIPAAIVEELEEYNPFLSDSTVDIDHLDVAPSSIEVSPEVTSEDEEEIEETFDSAHFRRKYIPMRISRKWGPFLRAFSYDTDTSMTSLSYWCHYIQVHCDNALVIPCLSSLVHLDLKSEFVLHSKDNWYHLAKPQIL